MNLNRIFALFAMMIVILSTTGCKMDKDDRLVEMSERRYDSLTAAAFVNIGLWLACLLPLVVAWLLLRQPQSSADDQAIVELMLEDLVANKLRLLSRLPEATSNLARFRAESSPDDEAI